MANTYQESPIFEQGNLSLQKINTPHLLMGIGAFFLFIQLLPGSIFLPLAFGAAGMYLLRQDNQPFDFRKSTSTQRETYCKRLHREPGTTLRRERTSFRALSRWL